MIYAIAALLVIILDQWMKYWVAGNVAFETGSQSLIPGLIKIVNIHNPGAAFSFLSGSNARFFLIGLSVAFVVLVILAISLKWISGSLGKWAAVFVMAGGIGNCIDRILYGYVQDMFMFEFVDFAIFNVADIFITVFCIVFIFYILFGGESKRARGRRMDDEDYDDDYDEDEEEYEEEPPKKAPKQKPVRKSRRTYDDDDEEEDDEEEEELPRKRVKAAPVRKARKDYDDEDEDEEPVKPVRKPVRAPAEDPFAAMAKAEREREAQMKKSAPAPAPVKREAPAPAPAPVQEKPKTSSYEDFSLDDILAEFK
ncbi:MAG: signal peptidase II [Oscillospiraceae bacterium]|nr:signal peptidase II [Oscillospiraceae bacterium]